MKEEYPEYVFALASSRSSSTSFGSFLGRSVLFCPRHSVEKPFGPSDRQIDPFPVLYSLMVDSKSLCCFTIVKLSFLHSFYHQLLEFWCVAFVWYLFWHNKAPHLLDSISYCLKMGYSSKSSENDMYPLYWTFSKEGIFMRYSYEHKRKCVDMYRHG